MEISRKFWEEHSEWSQATFGKDEDRGPLGPLKHLEKEAREAQNDAQMLVNRVTGTGGSILLPTEALQQCFREEIADCLLLTIDSARRGGMTHDELFEEAFRKLEINKRRKWSVSINDGEPCEHIDT